MTEQPTPREIRQSIADSLAARPGNVDAQGMSDADRERDSDRFARFTAAQTPAAEAPPAQVGMKPNRAQGHGSATVPTPPPANVLEAIRLQASKLL